MVAADLMWVMCAGLASAWAGGGTAAVAPSPQRGLWQAVGAHVIGFGVSLIQGDESRIGFLPACPLQLCLEISVSSPRHNV